MSSHPSQESAIIVAPNGAHKNHQHHPRLPITRDEIIKEVIACRDAGAAMVHLHTRDTYGQHTLDITENSQLYREVKHEVGDSIIVQLTTEAIGLYQPQQQMALIQEVKPEAASFALHELIPSNHHIDQAADFFHWVAKNNIIAQYIVYDERELARYFSLLDQGALPKGQHHLLFVLGRYKKQNRSTPSDLLPFLVPRLLDHKNRWSICAFGQKEHNCLTTAMLMGADVRVGFENNHYNCLGVRAQSNASQVAYLCATAQRLNIETIDANRFRNMLGAS
ncbi:3-keto-5-aminohexanoate cleavage protein [Vibrio sp. ZSDZ34]|jgi:uncharacterized protein (DUF849 family)|uniref:3-keto-5-aminohexanoate cleavage protein n=1 Tax=Vibrio gelatinilyticus TaxID=2893468 RepID=A0A9X1WCU0_9VIBR|nr:3-keto-5-aminohexanoate cleavage protein [Vibrio gelatinilyticus]MCJ2377676.1 3-keto-5-aminohexanoate cleavage protein [Vibrio gelatinilyticus]